MFLKETLPCGSWHCSANVPWKGRALRRPSSRGLRRLHVVGCQDAIHLDLDPMVADGDEELEPASSLARGVKTFLTAERPPSASHPRRVFMNLDLVSPGGPSFLLVLRVEVDPGVRPGLRQDLRPELEVLEARALDRSA